MRLKFHYLALIFLFSGWTNLVSSGSVTSKSGPYKSVVLKINTKCDKVTYPYEKVPSGYIDVKLIKLSNGTHLIRGNITIVRDNKDILMRLKGYRWENDKWNLIISMNNMGCHGAMFPILLRLTGLDMDINRCSVPKGSYTLKDLNVNDIDHIMSPTREYGKMKWRAEIYFNSATVACAEYETAILPAESSS